MTIFLNFTKTTYPVDTLLRDQAGWSEYRGRMADGTPFASAPDFKASADGLTYSVAGGATLQPRLLWDRGAPLERIQTVFKGPDDPSGGWNGPAFIFGPDEFNYVRASRLRFGVDPDTGRGTDALAFELYQDGTYVRTYGIWYNDALNYNTRKDLPAAPQIDLVFDPTGSFFNVYLNGEKQRGWTTSQNGPYQYDFALPSALQSPRRVGYWAPFGGVAFNFPLVVRDSLDYMLISDVRAIRYDTTRSKLRITGFCNKTGVSSVPVEVRDAANNLLFSSTAPVVGTAFSLDSGPIDPALAGSDITISAAVTGAYAETISTAFTMTRTFGLQNHFSIWQNSSQPNYYTCYPYNDLFRHLDWRTDRAHIATPGENYAAWAAVGESIYPASYADMHQNGSFGKFPDDGQHMSSAVPWTPEVGKYLMDLSAIPLLDNFWEFRGDLTNVHITRNYAGAYRHLVEFTSPIIGGGFSFHLFPNLTAPNKGVPTDGPWRITCTKLGSTADMVWCDTFREWIRQQAIGGIRYMTCQLAAEPFHNCPDSMFTPENRVKPDDQRSAPWGLRPAYPHEHVVQLHNSLDLGIWDNISRMASNAYRIERLTYYKQHLKAGLPYYVTIANERWLFVNPVWNAYARRGLKNGYGLVDADGHDIAVHGSPTGPWPETYPDWTAGQSYVAGDKVAAPFTGAIYLCTADDPSSASAPNLNPTHWRVWQWMNKAGQRAYAEDLLLLHDQLVSVWGSREAYLAGNVRIVCECWSSDFYNDAFPILAWGGAKNIVDMLATAPYLGGDAFDAELATISDAALDAVCNNTGSARVAACNAVLETEAAKYADQHISNSRLILKLEDNLGMPRASYGMGMYEGGQHVMWRVNNDALAARGRAAIDQVAWRADVEAVYKSMYSAYGIYYSKIAAEVGGTNCHFDAADVNQWHFAHPPGVPSTSYQTWGTSDYWTQMADDSGRFRSIRDTNIAYSGRGIIDLPAPRRRRRAPPFIMSS